MTTPDSNSRQGRTRRSREPLTDVGRELLRDPKIAEMMPNVIRDFPHVVNNLAALWRDPRQLDGLFDKLLLADRPGRQGFPLAAVAEISDLRNYYHQRIIPTLHQGSYGRGSAPKGIVGDEPTLGIATRRGTGYRV